MDKIYSLTEDLLVSDSISITSKNKVYNVFFNHNLTFDDYRSLGTHFLIDKNVLSHIGGELPNSVVIEATEEQKQYNNIGWIIEKFLNLHLKKDSHLVVIGGGITQDIGCWISSVFMRGIEWSFVPTTLLSQADSCIGSKSSINFNIGKNLLGTFYPPTQIIVNKKFRDTLLKQDIDSGISEIIKLLIIDNQDLHITDLDEAIYKALCIKRIYIELDEFDKGPRNILNYGHCFGHAIESTTKYAIPHGIAVAMGMDLANMLSDKLYDQNTFDRYHPKLKDLYHKFLNVFLDEDLIVQAMNVDKKNTLNFANIIMPLNGQIIKNKLENTHEFNNQLKYIIKKFKDSYAHM